AHARALLRLPDAVHLGTPRLHSASGPAEAGSAALDHGSAALTDPAAARLQVPATLPARVREMHGRAGPREPRGDARPSGSLLARGRDEALRARHDDSRRPTGGCVSANGGPLIEVRHVKKYFPTRKGLLQ